MQQPRNPLEKSILSALGTGRKTKGELKDVCQVPYPTLNLALSALKVAGEIDSEFDLMPGCLPVLVYRRRFFCSLFR